MATLREFELALQRDPTQTEAYLALRKAYREAGKWDKLVTLYELRAQALNDGPKAAELFYLAAEVRLDHLSDSEGAEADLAHAVDRDPDNVKAAHRLKLLYREQARLTDYAYDEAKRLLNKHRHALDRVAHALLEKETLDRSELEELLVGVAPESRSSETIGTVRALPMRD